MCNSESFYTASQLTFVENIFNFLEASTGYLINILNIRVIIMQVRFAACVCSVVLCCSRAQSLCQQFLKTENRFLREFSVVHCVF